MDSILWQIREFAEIDSTNTYLAQEAQSGAPEGVVARADFQSAGRGRLDRSWEAPRGVSLLASILLRPVVPPEQRFLVSAAVALSARTALTRLCGLQPALKWPNDLVVGDRKLGGLLGEVVGDDAPIDSAREFAVALRSFLGRSGTTASQRLERRQNTGPIKTVEKIRKRGVGAIIIAVVAILLAGLIYLGFEVLNTTLGEPNGSPAPGPQSGSSP